MIQPAQPGNSSFGYWVRRQRLALDMTQADLAHRVNCATVTIAKIERDERRPSRQIANLLADHLAIPDDIRVRFVAVALGEQAADHLPLAAKPVAPPAPSPQVASTFKLPAPSTPFVGRDAELARIAVLLANPDCKLLTLLGMGGMGKTRLAIEAAARQMGNFDDGVYFVSLAAVDTPEHIAGAIAQELDVTWDGDDLSAHLPRYLRPRQVLLILDNFEHLTEGADVVATLLRQAPRLKVLVTSRVRLHLLEEWLLPVDGMPVEEGLSGAAAQLFLRSAQRVQPGFTPAGQGTAILAICRQVGGMPLAIELAASWVRLMACEEIFQRITQDFEVLQTPVRNIHERHRSVRVLLEQSWSMLESSELAVLMRLSVFQSGFRMDEASHVTGANLPIMLALVDKSLVHSNGAGRYDLHELVRQYAAEQLAANGEDNVCRQHHFMAYLGMARTADRHLRGPQAVEWFDRLDNEQSNLRAAMQWALHTGHYEDLAWLGIALMWYWTRRGFWRDAVSWLEPTLAHTQAWPVDLRLMNLVNLYNFWVGLGSYAAIEQYAGELIQLAQRCNQLALQAVAAYMVALSATSAKQAADAYQEAILVARQVGNNDTLPDDYGIYGDHSNLLANLLLRYGSVLRSQGEYVPAQALYEESLALFRKMDCDSIVHPLGYLGRLALIAGDIAQAEVLIGRAQEISLATGSQLGLAECDMWLGLVRLYQGDSETAWQLLDESLRIWQDMESYSAQAKVLTCLAAVALARGNLIHAQQLLVEGLAYHALIRWVKPELVDCLFVAARLAAAQGEFTRAATLFGMGERLRVEIHHALDAPLRLQVETALKQVRTSLTEEQFAGAWQEGTRWTLDDALAVMGNGMPAARGPTGLPDPNAKPEPLRGSLLPYQ